MTMSILSNAYTSGDSVYYTESFRAVFEDHLEFLRAAATTVTHVINPEDAYMYRHRPYQFLTDRYQVEKQFHWYVLRLTGLTSPEEFDENIRQIRVPAWDFIRTLASNHQTVSKSV